MPDISMCATSDCPLRYLCRRSEASGTVAKAWGQSWSAFPWRRVEEETLCDHYWPTPAEIAARESYARMFSARAKTEGGERHG